MSLSIFVSSMFNVHARNDAKRLNLQRSTSYQAPSRVSSRRRLNSRKFLGYNPEHPLLSILRIRARPKSPHLSPQRVLMLQATTKITMIQKPRLPKRHEGNKREEVKRVAIIMNTAFPGASRMGNCRLQ